ncbi:MAG TPA: hypothetical protein VK826_13200 [Bacteroidia bacterium]|nr:hypothetical protein [Bacteroidia bacterium]
MSETVTHIFEAEIQTDKKKMKTIFIIGGIIFVISLGCVIWAHLNWEEHTYLVEDVITGEVSRIGIASTLFSWGLVFAIAIPVIYGLMWMSLDFKNPALAVNKRGLFINREGFKKAFITWNDFERIEKKGAGELQLFMKNPQEIVAQQPAFARPFLTQTFVKDRSAITLSAEDDGEKGQKIIDLVIQHSGLVS